MSDAEDPPLTLSREDLYELVWSKPMADLAKDFGISDVGLAKRCRRLGVPVPGRGYWARVDAGQAPYQPKLPERKAQFQDHRVLKVRPPVVADVDVEQAAEASEATCSDPGPPIPDRIWALAIEPTTSIADALLSVKRTARLHKYGKASDLIFARGERIGPVVDLGVTSDALERALMLADTLLRSAESLGWCFDDPKVLSRLQGREPNDDDTSHGNSTTETELGPPVGRLFVQGEQIAFCIEERYKEESREPTPQELSREKREYGYHAPRKTEVATGALRVVRLDTRHIYRSGDRKSWFDRKGKRVEGQIRDILLGFYELALRTKERRAKDEQEARERAIEQARREELEEIQEAHQRLIKQLETDAGAWHRARYLRRYVHAARKRLGAQGLPASFRNKTVDFLKWADEYINQLDPLEPAARTREFREGSTGYYHNDLESMKNAFGRLLGSDWSDAWKIGKDYTSPPKTDRYSYSHREKSVFDIAPPAPDDDE
jgi:hypothetical protein